MLLQLPDILNAAELADIGQLLTDAPWLDGRNLAGSQAQKVKNNQQLSRDCAAALKNSVDDVLKALALGANAVLIGRPFVFGLANTGAVGVAHVLRLLRDELEIAMALCGCATLAQASRALLFRSPDHRRIAGSQFLHSRQEEPGREFQNKQVFEL